MTDEASIITGTGGGLVGDASFYNGTLAQFTEPPKVKIEHREQVVRQVPFGLSIFSMPSMPVRSGRKDKTARRLGRGGIIAPQDVKLEPVNTSRKHGVGRNAKCPCGSGLKNKHCKCRG